MAEPIAIKITNLPQIRAAFNKAPALMTQGLNDAIKKSVFTIQAQSMRNTPVLTGRLRASHTSMFANLQGSVSTNTNYDVFVHNGTRFMKARPYMQEAVDSEGNKVQDFFTKAVDSVLHKIGEMT